MFVDKTGRVIKIGDKLSRIVDDGFEEIWQVTRFEGEKIWKTPINCKERWSNFYEYHTSRGSISTYWTVKNATRKDHLPAWF